MKLIKTRIEDLYIVKPKIYEDNRGYFIETYKESWYNERFPHINFIQENESKSKYGVLRGLHFQKPPYAQSKLVRVIEGEVLDVVVDLRINSKTFGMHETFILNAEEQKQLLIPRGFAHGFLVLSNSARFSYKVDNIYSPDNDSGILWNDEDLNIDWIIPIDKIKISEKDSFLPRFKNLKSPF